MQLVWGTVMLLHAGLAILWWWSMPGGFASSRPEFWVNQVAPFVLLALVAIAMFVRDALGTQLRRIIFGWLAIFWVAFAVTARVTFPSSFQSLWMLPMFAGIGMTTAWLALFRPKSLRSLLLIPAFAPAGFAGAAFAISQRALEPSTKPAAVTLLPAIDTQHDISTIKLNRNVQIRPAEGRLVLRRAAGAQQITLTIDPLLAFSQCNSDGAWTALAADWDQVPDVRKFEGRARDGAHWNLFYRDEVSSLDVAARSDTTLAIEARTHLAHARFCHLSDFTQLTLVGHHQLSIAFSPAGNRRTTLPLVNDPAQFAFLDERGVFRIMQAHQHNKGPFVELASGPLSRSEPLVVTLYDDGVAVFRLHFDDWASEISTAVSPATGNDIPANAIEFSLLGDSANSPAQLSLTLAATRIGRGVETVGHAAGNYRNRMTVETLGP